MISFFKKLFHQRNDVGVGDYPGIYSFPHVGPDGEITIDCIIRPTSWADGKNSVPHKQPDGRGHVVTAKCVGTLKVEVDELGLCLRWQPGDVGNDSFRFPTLTVPVLKPAAEPAKNRGNDDNVKPLVRAKVKVHGETPNVELTGRAKTPKIK